jgi:hypothetical protein
MEFPSRYEYLRYSAYNQDVQGDQPAGFDRWTSPYSIETDGDDANPASSAYWPDLAGGSSWAGTGRRARRTKYFNELTSQVRVQLEGSGNYAGTTHVDIDLGLLSHNNDRNNFIPSSDRSLQKIFASGLTYSALAPSYDSAVDGDGNGGIKEEWDWLGSAPNYP